MLQIQIEKTSDFRVYLISYMYKLELYAFTNYFFFTKKV